MATALYRRYRPETFSELIGQSQVTDPLSAALDSNRVNHAYLFSGPRGCGKTTSARILARCLNCAAGPTSNPCGKCDSCVELGRDGGGSLDVVEIDAASHNGVDDARDIRERAAFAPARDRYKIFILDEAHMVTAQGFNALLKIVEEPPEHVKFIFATTEPDKVIGTIRSRTHHYPFRLVAGQTMLDYVQEICLREGITAEPGVLALAVRAGGGSVRDTLSILDQLIAGSTGNVIGYDRAVALLGYTHSALLHETITALANQDGAAAFAAVNRAVESGQDPRRFVEDLLQRLRDLIVVAAGGLQVGALAGYSDAAEQELKDQAALLGPAKLSQLADEALASLDSLSGATSPKLQLELMLARMIVQLSGQAQAAAPIISGGAAALAAAGITTSQPTNKQTPAAHKPQPQPEKPAAAHKPQPQPEKPAAAVENAEVTIATVKQSWPKILAELQQLKKSAWITVSAATPVALRDGDILALAFPDQNTVDNFKAGGPEGPAEFLRRVIHKQLGIRVRYVAHSSGATMPMPRLDQQPNRGEQDAQPPQSAWKPTTPAGVAPPTEPVDDWATPGIEWGSESAADAAPAEKVSLENIPNLTSAATLGKKIADPAAESTNTGAANQAEANPKSTKPDAGKITTVGGSGLSLTDPERYGEAVVRDILGATPIQD